MALFTTLPLERAAAAYLFLHPLLATLAMYALARTLGMSAVGALVAAIAYGRSGFLSAHNACCFAFASLEAWLPLTMLGAERAIRSASRANRWLWWGVAGLALGQILGAWLGQGSYYALLQFGSYVAYRTLFQPPTPSRNLRDGLADLALHGTAPSVLAAGLAAAGLLPRIEYNALSNLAGGYVDSDLGVSGLSILDWRLLLVPSSELYLGGATLVLASAGPSLARRRFATPYFAAVALGTLVLSGQGPSPLHWIVDLLPGFARLHGHVPERIMALYFPAAALLAGATVTRLWEHPWGKSLSSAAVLSSCLLIAARASTSLAATLLLPMALATLTARSIPRPSPGLRSAVLALVLYADLLTAGHVFATHAMEIDAVGYVEKLLTVDLDTYYAPNGAARFLQARAEQESFRFFGYDRQLGEDGTELAYTQRYATSEAVALAVNNRAMRLGLEDVQGYNPIHLARYDEFLVALNGHPQNYHNAEILEAGLRSPLLDLLNVRYLVVPASGSADSADLRELVQAHPTVYEDRQTRVLENRTALPRAWIVHDARRVGPGEALRLLTSEEVDPRVSALLEEPPPSLARALDPSAERASIVQHGPDRIEVQITTDAPGLLVLSEISYPAWRAYVDGQPAPVYVADHVLRAVSLPAGLHTVELRYESVTLTIGILVSLATYAALGALALAAAARPRQQSRCRSQPAREPAVGMSRADS